jgi:hypothetical protein
MSVRRAAALAVLAVGAVGLLGCGGRFTDLANADQDLFQRCSEAIYPATCGASRDIVYRSICMRRAANEYAEGANADVRREWLIARGCPPPMVEPWRYTTGASGGAREVSTVPRPAAARRLCVRPNGRQFEVPTSYSCTSQGGTDFTTASAPGTPRYEAIIAEGRAERLVTREWDEFRRLHVIHARARVQAPEGVFAVTVHLTGFPGASDASVGLIMGGDGARYLRCRSVLALVGEEPFTLPTFDYSPHAPTSSAETFDATFTIDELRAIGNSRRTRIRVCNDVIEFDDTVRAMLRVFLREMIPASGGAADASVQR